MADFLIRVGAASSEASRVNGADDKVPGFVSFVGDETVADWSVTRMWQNCCGSFRFARCKGSR